MSNIQDTLNERELTHGSFSENSRIIQQLKDTARTGAGWKTKMTYAQKEAIDMILHKVGRAVNGDANFEDHWVDIIGYAELAKIDNSRFEKG